jgi:hypothetical protein
MANSHSPFDPFIYVRGYACPGISGRLRFLLARWNHQN